MAAETVGFAIQPEDRAELDRLALHFSGGNRSKFLRDAIQVMAARERAERLHQLGDTFRQAMVARYGRELTTEELNEITRRVVKGKTSPDMELPAPLAD